MNNIIPIYSDKSYLPENIPHIAMLYPFWGIHSEVQANQRTYQTYHDIGNSFFQMTDLDQADWIIAPSAWEKSAQGRELTLQLAQHATPQKPIIIFFWHDSTEDVNVPNSIIFRTSFYKSTQKQNEYAMPAWGEDFIQTVYDGELVIRQKQPTPTIGFCGYAMTQKARWIQNLKDIARYIKDGASKTREKRAKRAYHVVRGKILNQLSKSKRVQPNFIIRDQFHGAVNPQQRQIERTEYIQNIINSDYVLCIRGAGNFSYRLYETLSCGRIPVFINTDCVLPYDFAVDWKKYCVWVEETDLAHLDEKVRQFHDNLSPEAFIQLQRDCRQFWKDYISPEGFFQQFYHHFER